MEHYKLRLVHSLAPKRSLNSHKLIMAPLPLPSLSVALSKRRQRWLTRNREQVTRRKKSIVSEYYRVVLMRALGPGPGHLAFY